MPARIAVQQDVLSEFEFAPGNPWEASYAVRVRLDGRPAVEGLLLTVERAARDRPARDGEGSVGSSRHGQARMTREFIRQGILHVLSGSTISCSSPRWRWPSGRGGAS